ncbi:acyl-[ACP]--phospholipid O-acyltransferase [Marinobacterium jannaschii]|uniref:acyl-[ACP]--phospholipid O-acyltransferase n=1 Tax=Marinobacterium jannaschii TaxID=64970 RepID=UPI00048329A1|nr:acyl-[ACP]--phospholipid O-acyltransferase [Marinobacterium jannaschii]
MKALLSVKGFLAFISVAFINAFVDLGHKIVIQNTLFKGFEGETQILLTAIVNGLILLPFILLFTPSGFLADKYPKHRVMRLAAAGAVLITLLITWCYYQGLFELAFGLTFVLALQSAFYSPAKYGYIKQLVGTENLSEGNGWVQAVTMIAILAGIVVFSALFEIRLEGVAHMAPEQSLQIIAPLGWVLVAGSVIELLLALRLPKLSDTDEQAHFDWAAYTSGRTLRRNFSLIYRRKAIWLSILGLTLFWSISQVMLAVFPAFAEEYLGQHNTFVIQGVMALAGIGIMLGSMVVGRLSTHYINVGLIPLGAAGVALGLILLPMMDSMTLLAGVFLLIGFTGALMNVPLNALVQFHAEEHETGRVLAGSNFIQNIGMLSFLGLTVAFALASVDGIWLLWLLAAIGIGGAVFAIVSLPEALIRVILAAIFKQKYRLKVLGFEHLPEEGKGTLLLGNHISWLDWAMLQLASPRHIHFVMDRGIYSRWYLKWFFDLYRVIPISGGQSRQALDQVRELLNQGEMVCLFPEGTISHIGQLNEFKRGFERACEGADGVIIPFYLRGLWGSLFSRSADKLKQLRSRGLKRDVIVAFGAPLPIDSTAETVKKRVFELSIHTWEQHTRSLETLPQAFIRTAKAAPAEWAITDVQGQPVSYARLLTGARLFSKRLKSTSGQNLGLLLPTSTAGAIANMAALMAGKTLVNLNFTASTEALLSGLKQAEVSTILTAHKFVRKLEQKGIDVTPLFEGRDVLYMEDLKEGISKAEGLTTLITAKLLPVSLLQLAWCRSNGLEDTAAILFSSGSEGAPKGVMLSQRNIMANLRQVSDMLNVREEDRIMATLPLFHAFGLTVTCFMPLIEGIPVVCHPDPTDALSIGKGVAKYRATFMCATSTFLRMYTRNRKVHPLMFKSLRVVVAGAEKLDNAVREAFESKYHVQIIEGYGCTETTPVAGVNLPDHLDTDDWRVQHGSRLGTVGLALPGSTFRIVDPDTLEELPTGTDGLILIGGTQIMKGYLGNPQKTADVVVEMDGIRWYKSGDKGHVDEDGFLTIVDRYSRFAKLGGEMVSLTSVESEVRRILKEPELPMVAVNLPDAKKGEKVVLLLEGKQDPRGLREQLISAGMAALTIPSAIHLVDQVPMLGSGKTDFSRSRLLAEAAEGVA